MNAPFDYDAALKALRELVEQEPEATVAQAVIQDHGIWLSKEVETLLVEAAQRNMASASVFVILASAIGYTVGQATVMNPGDKSMEAADAMLELLNKVMRFSMEAGANGGKTCQTPIH